MGNIETASRKKRHHKNVTMHKIKQTPGQRMHTTNTNAQKMISSVPPSKGQMTENRKDRWFESGKGHRCQTGATITEKRRLQDHSYLQYHSDTSL